MEHVDKNLSINSNPPPSLPYPAISVIIPLYNAGRYIGECLNSIFVQKFQSFEVIVVDDCSTDSSRYIVEEYIKKFPGRIKLSKTEKNSGGAGKPRNIGLNLAEGEYIFFVDADDLIRVTALEILYSAAKECNADVVYTGSYYGVKDSNTRTPDNVYLHRDYEGQKLREKGMQDKSDLRVDNPTKNLQGLLLEDKEGNFSTAWSKFIRRDFLLKNKILFPETITLGEDFIWSINVYCHAKRFLRIPTPIYFHRLNAASISRIKRKPAEQIVHWISEFVNFEKSLLELENKNEILSKNPDYRLSTLRRNFNWCLDCTKEARTKLSSKEIFDILRRELKDKKDLSDLLVSFFFTVIDREKKINEENLQKVDRMKNLFLSFTEKHSSTVSPAISIVIPLYNAERYISECLDSVLAQTFQSFEVIVADDCSTDSSCEIIESYIPKFNGRLKLYHMDENTGSGALPRNKGLLMSSGEYVFFLDADDMLTKTAMEELYLLAKEYDAEAIYCEKHYEGTDLNNMKIHGRRKRGIFVDEPTFESEDLSERAQAIMDDSYLTTPWSKFVRRDLIIDNEIFFPALKISEDNVWTQSLLFCAKKFLRVPNIVYFYRVFDDSITRVTRTPQQHINFWLNPVLLGLKGLNEQMSKHAFFEENPSSRYDLLKKFVNDRFNWTIDSSGKLPKDIVYASIKDKFGAKFGEYDVLIPALCTIMYTERNIFNYNTQILRNFGNFITARIDIKFISKNEGNFQIYSVSDDKSKISKPSWFNKGGIGYLITSYIGMIKFVAKATVGGSIQLLLRGLDVRTPEDTSKRIPYWIDYTSLTVNRIELLNAPIPAWHDKPFRYDMDIKADEEITVQVEWLPHRSDT